MPKMRILSGGEFARRLSSDAEGLDTRYAFFLGAGCSASCGIPTAASLVVERWLPRLREFAAPEGDGRAWIDPIIPKWDPDNPAASYGDVMERLFFQPEQRQREIELLCDGKYPGFGYAVLAALMARDDGAFNVALTTNFDDLLTDALYLFTSARPLVIHHETLASFIRPTRRRPLVVKLHGDNRLSPLNTDGETERLKQQLQQHVPSLLHDGGLIIIGYGGNDEGIASLFKSLAPEALPLGVYWVSKHEPGDALRTWLDERGASWVQEADFDETMLLLRDAFELPHPTEAWIDDVFLRYRETYERLSESIVSRLSGGSETATLKAAVARTDDAAEGSWWRVYLAAQRVHKTAPDEAEAIYLKGLEQFPRSADLIDSYATFLADRGGNPARVEEMYEHALSVDPEHIGSLLTYARFLRDVRQEFDRAEEILERAVAARPGASSSLVDYATFLALTERDLERSRVMFERAIAIDGQSEETLGNYSALLFGIGETAAAEEVLQRALDVGVEPERALGLAYDLYANGDPSRRSSALEIVKQRLSEGIRCLGWNFDLMIRQAERAGHENMPLVRELAEVLTFNRPPEILTAYEEFGDWDPNGGVKKLA
jgi:tetratricopeptide (TPR) repeat protein